MRHTALWPRTHISDKKVMVRTSFAEKKQKRKKKIRLKQYVSLRLKERHNNGRHLYYNAGLSSTILKEDLSSTILAKFGLICFRSFRGEDLNIKV
jgi:hypothetical protein